MKKRMVFALTALCLVVGVAYAYFTSVKTLNIGSFGTATLEIELASETTGSADTLLPGESVQVGWSATNSGDRELHLMGSINPTFVDSSLDSSYLTVESIERNNAGVWEPVQVSSEGVFFYSDDGSESNLLSLLPSQSVQYRASISLASEAGNEYQAQDIATNVVMGAKQIDADVWPAL